MSKLLNESLLFSFSFERVVDYGYIYHPDQELHCRNKLFICLLKSWLIAVWSNCKFYV